MTPLGLILLSVLLYVSGAALSLLFARTERLAITASGIAGALGGAVGIAAAIPVLLAGSGPILNVAGPISFAHFTVRFDPLAAFMVCVISLLVLVAAIYSAAYVREYEGRGAWSMGFFMNLFVAAMIALVVVDNAFYFLIFFEMMSLASYFLVIFDQDEEAVSAGFLYFLIAHAGSVLILIAFFILFSQTGSFDFAEFRNAKLSPALASTVFLLAFFGFGAKAGMVPLHSWLPRAHPAAPSHASALMSGVMVKIGVFGIIKVGVDLLGATTTWWGLVVLGFGAVSAVLGVLYALAENDIKRLLAYSSVENVGIILMGVGIGMVGMASGHPVLASLGLLAALYHTLNHAVFKGLLFLCAGSILYRTHTRNMEHLGGLARKMPHTALAVLIGCMAISALPPLNGFVSEWFTYQALFTMSHDGSFAVRFAGPIVVVMLAITGALAAMSFVKLYGVSFSGAPRSNHAAEAREAPMPMALATSLLALACIALGLGAPAVAPLLAKVATSLSGGAALSVTDGSVVFPGSATQALLSTPLVAVLLLAMPMLPLLIGAALKGPRMSRRHGGDPWACGYAHDPRMAMSATSFAQPLRVMFESLYKLRQEADPSAPLATSLQALVSGATRVEPTWDEQIIAPLLRAVQWLGHRVQWLQHGDFRVYCLYVVAALGILLLVTVA